jgi:hypothetical protein
MNGQHAATSLERTVRIHMAWIDSGSPKNVSFRYILSTASLSGMAAKMTSRHHLVVVSFLNCIKDVDGSG